MTLPIVEMRNQFEQKVLLQVITIFNISLLVFSMYIFSTKPHLRAFSKPKSHFEQSNTFFLTLDGFLFSILSLIYHFHYLKISNLVNLKTGGDNVK